MFFGKLGELIGRSVALDASPATVGDLRLALAQRHPDAAAELLRPSVRACVGDELVADDHALAGIDVVEFLPPLSGG
jgi:molybdopterin converting factor small subunit